jgi:hypothetical protein
MVIYFFTARLRRDSGAYRNRAARSTALLLLVTLVSLSCASRASAWPVRDYEPATVLEAASYIPCVDACSLFDTTADTFCLRLGDRVIVGEEKSHSGEAKAARIDDLTGQPVSVHVGILFISIKPLDGHKITLKPGSLYEGFRDKDCVAEVHKPILAHADSMRRSAKVPDGAMAIAGSGRGDYQPLFLWYQCEMDSAGAEIACRRWYVNGDSDGVDWYCAKTTSGAPVPSYFSIDPLLSQSGRLVLTTGAVLQHDDRARTNDMLDRPGEACR